MDTGEVSKFIVTEKAKRPASDAEECFYCRQAVGHAHLTTCVTIHRKVRVKMAVTYEIEVPAGRGADGIEFHRNESSWCADNAVGELVELVKASEDGARCLCGDAEFEYVGEVDGAEPYLRE